MCNWVSKQHLPPMQKVMASLSFQTKKTLQKASLSFDVINHLQSLNRLVGRGENSRKCISQTEVIHFAAAVIFRPICTLCFAMIPSFHLQPLFTGTFRIICAVGTAVNTGIRKMAKFITLHN
jgi:hypothetical protein